jgi:hypothetical protein
MSTPMHALLTGSFTSDGLTKNISLPSGYSSFEMINITDIGSSAANTNVMRAQGTSSMSAGSAYYSPKTSGAATNALETTTTTGGFTFVSDSASLLNGPLVATSGTDISRANPAVVSTGTTTNLVAGTSVVRLVNNTGMLQVSGMDFTVGTISASTSFQLKYLDNSGFAADSTAGFYRIINATDRFYPKSRFITAITQAASAVITMSVSHGYVVGQSVRIAVPAAFGMTEINGLLGTITAVTTGSTNTITVDINSTGFTAFAFPTSAVAAAGVSFAQVVPVGEAAINSVSQPYGNLLDDATNNTSFTGVSVGTTVQTSGSVYQWFARKGVAL